MIGYHGTASAIATHLAAGKVDVTKGGGELGRGFYTAEHIYVAKAWAVGRYDERKDNVVQFDVPDSYVVALHCEIFDGPAATMLRNNIRKHRTTRTHTFGCDMVWAPIVGKETVVSDQYKWESPKAETLLNGPIVSRKVV